MPTNVEPEEIHTIRSFQAVSLSPLSGTALLPPGHTGFHLHKNELIGIRRKARSLFHDWSARKLEPHSTIATDCSTTKDAVISPNNTLAEDVQTQASKHSYHSIRRHGDLQKTSPSANPLKEAHWRTYLQARGNRGITGQTINDSRETLSESTSTMRLTERIRSPTHIRIPLSENDSVINVTERFSDLMFKNGIPIPQKRVIQIRNLVASTGIKSVLAQVCGGPLEKVVVHRSEVLKHMERSEVSRYPLGRYTLEIWFVNPLNANEFMLYGHSGLFIVNGFRYIPEWAPPHETVKNDPTQFHQPVSPHTLLHINKRRASRVIWFRKTVPVVLREERYYNPLWLQYSKIDVGRLSMEFSQYGDIIEVFPVLSKKLIFGIHYYDIQSAMAVKSLFEDPTCSLHRLFPGFQVVYSADITDIPCINV